MNKTLYLICFLSFLTTSLSAQWSVENLSSARYNIGIGSVNDKVFFAGSSPSSEGMVLDIYDINAGSWTTEQLSIFRQFTFATGIGDKMYFAGYTQTTEPDQDIIEIYDTNDGTWSTMEMSNLSYTTSMTSVGDVLVLVNGNSVSMYNTTTGSWAEHTLSVDRILALAIGCNGKVVFAGGGFLAGTLYDLVDIYDVASNTWTTANMTEGKNQIEGACVNDKIYLVGGATGFSAYSQAIEIFDTNTDTWSLMQMNAVKSSVGVGATDSNLYITGGRDEDIVERVSEVEIINGSTGEKTTSDLSSARSATSAFGVGDRLFVAGGFSQETSEWTTTVDIYQEAPGSNIENVATANISVFPNPTNDNITISYAGNSTLNNVNFEIFDTRGVLLMNGKLQNEITISHLDSGMYFLQLDDSSKSWTKFVKL